FSSRRRHTRFSRDWSSDVCSSDLDDDPDAERKAKDSANRNLATPKAALNLAYRMGLVSTTAQWDRVESFQKVGRRRERFLTVARSEERRVGKEWRAAVSRDRKKKS